MSTLIVTDEIIIHAPPARVWTVLAKPAFIREWDDLPADFPEDMMNVGREVVWRFPDGRVTRNTVIKAEAQKELQLSLYVSDWKGLPTEEVIYGYEILMHEDNSRLRMRHGDFAYVPDGEKYYAASAEFADVAKQRIKRLAERT
ncbi:SRPBCC family protein [Lentibacillus sediminis]|uniref:SRPBCC family protein n=1 Tax=Lentibacillus sediminis TaxID=1940529 RepID=UPI000C1C7019|nr:SRPBCC domain-containing protein [Lentibacillus sediminis]